MRLAIILIACFAGGCNLTRSRYAMDDMGYADKYRDGAAKSDFLGKLKQSIDARHVEGMGGLYAAGGVQVRPNTDLTLAGGEVGYETYPTSWSSLRGGVSFYASDTATFAGVDVAARAQPPSRLAPFLGMGMFVGHLSLLDILVDGEDKERDGNGLHAWSFAGYPEVGVHFWLNGRARFSAYGRYFVTTEGRQSDEWFLGGQVNIFSR